MSFGYFKSSKASNLCNSFFKHLLLIENDDAACCVSKALLNMVIDQRSDVVEAQEIWNSRIEDVMFVASCLGCYEVFVKSNKVHVVRASMY